MESGSSLKLSRPKNKNSVKKRARGVDGWSSVFGVPPLRLCPESRVPSPESRLPESTIAQSQIRNRNIKFAIKTCFSICLRLNLPSSLRREPPTQGLGLVTQHPLVEEFSLRREPPTQGLGLVTNIFYLKNFPSNENHQLKASVL